VSRNSWCSRSRVQGDARLVDRYWSSRLLFGSACLRTAHSKTNPVRRTGLYHADVNNGCTTHCWSRIHQRVQENTSAYDVSCAAKWLQNTSPLEDQSHKRLHLNRGKLAVVNSTGRRIPEAARVRLALLRRVRRAARCFPNNGTSNGSPSFEPTASLAPCRAMASSQIAA